MTDDPDTRERILDAAKSAFLSHGTAGARMQDIADGADVNKALLHYYFQTKDNLATAVFVRELRRMLQPVLRALSSERPLEEKVHRVIDTYLDHLSDFPLMPGYVLAEMHFHPQRLEELFTSVAGDEPGSLGARIFDVIGGQIDQAVEEGRIRPIDPRQFVVNLIGLCVFPFAARPLLLLLTGGEGEFDDLISRRRETLADFFLGALRP